MQQELPMNPSPDAIVTALPTTPVVAAALASVEGYWGWSYWFSAGVPAMRSN